MSEVTDTLEVGNQATTSNNDKVKLYNPFPEDRRINISPEEKLKMWIKEQGERDRQAAQLMKKSKKTSKS